MTPSRAGRFVPYVVGRDGKVVLDDLGGFRRELAHDSPLRRLGPGIQRDAARAPA